MLPIKLVLSQSHRQNATKFPHAQASYTLSGRIGKVVASDLYNALIYIMHEVTVLEGEGCDQSIGSTVSNAIVRSWLWSTATRSSPLLLLLLLKEVGNARLGKSD